MREFRRRLHAVIPGGAHTYSRGDDQFPSNAPPIFARARGAYIWDPDDKSYLDYGMALRAVTLGYADSRVNAAAAREMERGVNLTRASVTELEAAETLVELIPSADMVKFAKNGSNVTTAAAKLARAHTGRRFLCVPRQHPFFSFDDWFIGTTSIKKGIPPEHHALTLLFDYGEIGSLERLFDDHADDIAGVMLEPATTVMPCSSSCDTPLSYERPCNACPQRERNFLHEVQAVCRRHGALFILDEMITGFRWHLGGAQTYFGVDPDLSTFGKAMANGFSVAALVGKRAVMEAGSILRTGEERTFLLSTTHGAEMPGLGAFMETVRIYKQDGVVKHLWHYGRRLFDGMQAAAAANGVRDEFLMEGCAISMNFVTRDRERKPSLEFRTLFLQELMRRGVVMPWIAVSLAHGDTELARTLEAVHGALGVYRRALEDGVERYLEGPAVRPVFRQFN